MDSPASLAALITIKPETPRELWEYIRTHCRTSFGESLIIPHRSICRGHSAPFAFVSDAFFKVHSKQLAIANRSGGKTQDLGLLAWLELFFEGYLPSIYAERFPLEILDVGAVEEQAGKCFSYTDALAKQDEFEPYRIGGKAFKESIVLADGSSLKITVATMKGVNGPHPPRAHIDEVDLWDWTILQQAMSMPQSAGPHRACIRFTSTQKYGLGNVQRLLDESARRGIAVYRWCIFEVLEPCPPERVCKECRIFEFPDDKGGRLCGGKAKHSSGYYRIQDFIDKVELEDRDTIETEWLCLRPSREGLVFGADYREEIHRSNFEISWTPGLPLELSLDQGYSNPCAVLFLQMDEENDQLRIIGELYERHKLPEEMGTLAADRLAKWGVPTDKALEVTYDPEDPAAAATFVKHLITSDGKRRYYAKLRRPGGKQSVLEWLKLCRRRLKIRRDVPPRLVISRGVKWLPYEFSQYHYKAKKTESGAQAELPVDENNHAISAWYRYEARHAQNMKVKTGKDPR